MRNNLVLALILALSLTAVPLIILQAVHAYDMTPPYHLAPDFSITGLNGNTFSFSSFRGGKVTLLEFFHTTCPYCQNEASQLIGVKSHYGNSIPMISVSQDSSDWSSGNGTLLAFMQNYHVTWTVAEDTGGGFGAYGNFLTQNYPNSGISIGGVPQIYIIDKDGYMRYVDQSNDGIGVVYSSTMIAQIDGLLQPVVVITAPTSASPVFTRSGVNVAVGWNYTETSPRNATIRVYNTTQTVGQVSMNISAAGVNVSRLDAVPIDSSASNGAYNVNVTMYNQNGNVGQNTSLNSVVVDNILPTVNIEYPTGGAYLPNSVVWVNGTVTEVNMGSNQPMMNASGFTLQSWNSTSGKFGFRSSSLADGLLSVRVNFTDLANNTGLSTASFTIDTIKPALNIEFPTGGAYLSSGVVWINGTVTEANIGSHQPSINVTSFTLQSWNAATGKFGFINNTAVPEGLLSVMVNFTDLAGNIGSGSTSFTIDTTKSVVTVSYPTGGAYLSNPVVWVNGTVTEADIGSNVPLINDTRFTRSYWSNVTGSFGFKNSSSLPEGRVSVTVNFTDLANNTGVTSMFFTLDTTAPILSITAPSAGACLSNSTVWVNGTLTDANIGSNMPSINATGFTLSDWNATSGKFGFRNTSVSDGTLSVKVNFTDMANNTGFASTYFTVDTIKPVVIITYPSAGAYLNSSAVWVNGTVTEANVGSNQPSINDSRFTLLYWNAGTRSFGFKNSSSLTDGRLSVAVNFTDVAGNTGAASTYFTVDTTAPAVSVAYPTKGAYVDLASTVWVNGTVTELNMGALEPSMNDTRFYLASWDPGTGNFGFSNDTALSEESVSVTVSFTDLAGNTGLDIVTFTLGVPTRTCLVVRGMDNGIYYRISLGDSWGNWNALSGATCDSPAAAVYQNQLRIVVRGIDGNTLWYGSVDLSTSIFSGWSSLDGSTPSAPTLASNGTMLCLVVQGLDNRIYYRCYNGSWASWQVVPTGATCDSPAAAMLGSDLHIVVRGMDENSLWDTIVRCDGTVVRDWFSVSGATPSKPVLACSGPDKLCLVVRGLNSAIYYKAYTNSTDSWGGWSVLPTGVTIDGPGATVMGNELCTVVRGSDGNTLWYADIDLDTSSFLGWTLLDGATPSAPTLAS